jgi:ribosomal protein L22
VAKKPAQPDQGKPDEAAVETDAADAKQAAAEEVAAEQAESTEPEAEAAPKRRRRRRKATAEAPAADEAKQEAAAEDAESEAAEAAGEPEAEDEDATPAAGDDAGPVTGDAEEAGPADEEKPRRRRRASEVSAGRKREPATPAPRSADGQVAVRARAKYVRTAPRKARLVIDHIRGKPVDQARAILVNTPRAASRDVLKLLESAIANAENNHELVADELVVGQAFVDEGPTLKRYRPRALGRATRIRKRTSHMTITLTTSDRNGG